MRTCSLILLLSTICGATEKKPTQYIPLPCMSRMVIHSFGKCSAKDGQMTCPDANISFLIGCTSIKPETTAMELSLTRPNLVQLDVAATSSKNLGDIEDKK
jgi:hypothetical protein